MNRWLLLTAVWNVAKASNALQISIFLPLTLVTLGRPAFLSLSLLLSLHALIHGALIHFWGSPALSFLQLPVHPFLLLLIFNAFSSSVGLLLQNIAFLWGQTLTFAGPLFIAMEGLSSLLVAQKLGQNGKRLVERGESYQFALLIASAVVYVFSASWIVVSYPEAASSPLSSTLLGVAMTALVFITFIGFVLRRTNIIESATLTLFIAYNVWLCGYDGESFSYSRLPYVPLLPNVAPHFQALVNFVVNTVPKPLLLALIYRLFILHLASKIMPTIGADAWESEEGVDDTWDDRPTSTLTRILLTYKQFIFVIVYSNLLMLDHTSQVWWRWISIFFTLFMWAVELLVGSEEDSSKTWKVD